MNIYRVLLVIYFTVVIGVSAILNAQLVRTGPAERPPIQVGLPSVSATIQAQIDALVTPPHSLEGVSATGGIVMIPTGTITLDKPLTVPSYVHLRGQCTGTHLGTKYVGPAIILTTITDNGYGAQQSVEDMQIAVTGGTAISLDKKLNNTENIAFRNLDIFGGGIDCRMPNSSDNITYQPTFERIRFQNWGAFAIRCAPRMGRFTSLKFNGQTQATPALDLDGWALSGSINDCWFEGTAGPFVRITGKFSRFTWNASNWNEQHWSNGQPQIVLEGGANLIADYIVARDIAPVLLKGGSTVTGANVMPMDASGNLIDRAKAFVSDGTGMQGAAK